jgi:hypothetical protein
MARTNVEWVAQVSLLRPGCLGWTYLRGETQVSKARPGPPTYSLEVAVLRSLEGHPLGGEVVNQSERILKIASRELRLVLDDLCAVFHQPELGFFQIVNGDLKHRPQRRASLDEQVDVLPMQTDQIG